MFMNQIVELQVSKMPQIFISSFLYITLSVKNTVDKMSTRSSIQNTVVYDWKTLFLFSSTLPLNHTVFPIIELLGVLKHSGQSVLMYLLMEENQPQSER
jgi:hypothetical protein